MVKHLRRTGTSGLSLLIVGLFIGGALGLSTPSSAHSTTYYMPKPWASDPYYYFGDLDAPLNTSEAKTSIHYGDNPWDDNAGTWLDFHNSGYSDSRTWNGSACSTASWGAVWIISHSLSGLGSEWTCSTSSNTTRSVILLDDTRSNWYTGSSWSVPSGKYDLRSVIVHEFGHAGGFEVHFDGLDTGHIDNGEDCTGSDRETMCSGLPTGTSYKRSIQTHENHTFDSRY